MPVPEKIRQLVERFDQNITVYKAGKYNEAQARQEFINPFFQALGWDMANASGQPELTKEVIHEDALTVEHATKAPDYCFRLGGLRKFFVEAKKPSIYLKEDIHPAYQLRRYGWSAKLPVSILTDFEEFAVYDCRVMPGKQDKASQARLWYLTYTDYEAQWDAIANIFSRAAVLNGSFEQYADAHKDKRGTVAVDVAFLQEIERWRDLLARNFAALNPTLTRRELNFAVQRTIDRMIFLRICEDRGIEEYGRLMALQNGARVYQRLLTLFYQADDRYNSGIFHFKTERAHPEPHDALTPQLQLDDAVLQDIFKNLYYPDSPYEFSVISADILGQVYEQFLGKVICLTTDHQAQVEEKPEVKKAGGVYYTPTYIVAYIVKHTVGELLNQQNLTGFKNLSGFRLTILDPACGSGSFLIGAYQYLLDWYHDQYGRDPQKWSKGKRPRLYQIGQHDWKLTIDERKRILLAHLYGVDIDSQAVEVTKLSLLLKVLEGENEQTISSQMALFRERVLPDLANNIKCGNSLIGSDFYHNQPLSLFNEDEHYQINVFDWENEFPNIVGSSGFDVIIGNPPYGFHQIHEDYLKPYFKAHLASSQGSFEHYFLFYERSLRLLKKGGLHGFIVPVTWLTIPSAHSLRKFVLENYSIKEISWLPEFVFANAKVNTLVSIIKNSPMNDVTVKIYDTLGFGSSPKEERIYKQSQFIESGYLIGIFESHVDHKIIQKIIATSQPLKNVARPCSGYNPYEVGKGQTPEGTPHTKETVKTKPYHAEKKLGAEWKPEIIGRNLRRYNIQLTGNRWVKYGLWLAAPRDPDNFQGKRILVQEITGGQDKRIVAVYHDGELYHSRDIIPIKIENNFLHPFYLLGIINSWLISWYHLKRNPKAQKGLFPKVLVSDLSKLPICLIDSTNQTKHDKLVELVTQIMELHKQLTEANVPQMQIILKRQIETPDKQIDQLVYELYGLTAEEIQIVEAGA